MKFTLSSCSSFPFRDRAHNLCKSLSMQASFGNFIKRKHGQGVVKRFAHALDLTPVAITTNDLRRCIHFLWS